MLSASFFTSAKLWFEIRSGPVAPSGPQTISKQYGYLYVARLNASLATRRVKQFVNAVLVVVGREKDHVLNVMISDVFEQLITLRAIAAHPRLTTIAGNRRVGARSWR